MFGDGMVSLGTAVVTWDFRKEKASPKIVSSMWSLPSTRMDAGVYSMSPAALWNRTARWPGAGGDRDADAPARLGDLEVVAVGREGGGDCPGPFGINHVLTSTAVPDHSPKTRTTIEIAALRAPATTIGTCRGDGRMRVKVSSPLVSASAKRAMPRSPFFPARRRSAPVRPQWSISQ